MSELISHSTQVILSKINVARLILYGERKSNYETSWTAVCSADYILVNCGMQCPGFSNFWWGMSWNTKIGEMYAIEYRGRCRVDVDFNGFSCRAAALYIRIH